MLTIHNFLQLSKGFKQDFFSDNSDKLQNVEIKNLYTHSKRRL